jgi:ABC-type Fe3+-hydroxamate transport system substrate-binding protein
MKLPRRIVSVVPSLTELLFELGLDQRVAGITKFCIHPESWYRTKTRIGGTKNLDIKKITELSPDLIIANKEENTKEQIEILKKDYPLLLTDIHNLDEAVKTISEIASITGTDKSGKIIINEIDSEFDRLKSYELAVQSCAYIIWNDPLMSVGGDTFISDILRHAGYKNVFGNKIRYPETSISELQKIKPEVILLSSEPFPFKEKHLYKMKEELIDSEIMLVDGEMFSWYGSRLKYSPAYFLKLREEIDAES